MAKVEYITPIERVHGKVKHDSRISFRGGHTYYLLHPRTEKDFSEHEKAYRRCFGELTKTASQINKDEGRKDEYQDWKDKGYTSRYRYILAKLVEGRVMLC